jgi:hypothetical protein
VTEDTVAKDCRLALSTSMLAAKIHFNDGERYSGQQKIPGETVAVKHKSKSIR